MKSPREIVAEQERRRERDAENQTNYREGKQLELETKLRAAERAHDLTNDLGKRLMDAAIRDAQEAIKVVVLLNGAAALALLSFIGAIVSKQIFVISEMRPVVFGLWWFFVGTILGGFTAALAYASNRLHARGHFAKEKIFEPPFITETPRSKSLMRSGTVLNWLAVVLAFLGLLAFIFGVYFGTRAILSLSVGR